jgi:hypothetical protein
MSSGWVTGFTLRVKDFRVLSETWTSERRSRFLLRNSLKFALSFDDLVWPRCGSVEEWSALFSIDLMSAFGLEGFEFLDELMVLRPELSQLKTPPLPALCQLVAVSTPHSWEAFELRTDALCSSFPRVGKSLPWTDMWTFLGFDVVESCLGISGLSNCGYSEDDLVVLGKKYGQKLNGYGLFEDIEEAIKCSRDTTSRIPEHAPFVPTALFGFELETSAIEA